MALLEEVTAVIKGKSESNWKLSYFDLFSFVTREQLLMSSVQLAFLCEYSFSCFF